jgi:hypothetical protein
MHLLLIYNQLESKLVMEIIHIKLEYRNLQKFNKNAIITKFTLLKNEFAKRLGLQNLIQTDKNNKFESPVSNPFSIYQITLNSIEILKLRTISSFPSTDFSKCQLNLIIHIKKRYLLRWL